MLAHRVLDGRLSTQVDTNKKPQGGSLAGETGFAAAIRGEPLRQGPVGLPDCDAEWSAGVSPAVFSEFAETVKKSPESRSRKDAKSQRHPERTSPLQASE